MGSLLKFQLHSGTGAQRRYRIVFLYIIPYIYSLGGILTVYGRNATHAVGVIQLHIPLYGGTYGGYGLFKAAVIHLAAIAPCADICAECAVVYAVSPVLLEHLSTACHFMPKAALTAG